MRLFRSVLAMLEEIFREWLARFPPEVLRGEPEALVIQVFLGDLYLSERAESGEAETVLQEG